MNPYNQDDFELDLSMLLDPTELSRSLTRNWRLQQEDRPISLRTSISGALNKQPALWVGGMAKVLGIDERTKKQRVVEIARALTDPFSLSHIVERLPTLVRRIVKTVLDRGGWVPYASLLRTFGDDHSDGWDWEQEPPQSPIGQARLHGLLVVGTTDLNGELCKVAVIPRELREALEKILALEEAVDLDSAVSGTDLAQVLADVDDYYAEESAQLLVSARHVHGYLTRLAAENPGAVAQAWSDIELLLWYFDEISDDLERLDHLADYQISELANEFLDDMIAEYVDLASRQHLLHTLAGLYAYLSDQGIVRAATAIRVKAAVHELTQPKHKLSLIPRPDPLGGEPVFQVEEGRQLITYTFNDLWLMLAALAQHSGNLIELQHAATGVPDGAVKRKRIEWLLKHDLTPLKEYVMFLPDAAYAVASDWFYNQTFNRGNAWLPNDETS